MDSEIKAKWTAALRSGKYHQGAHALRSKGAEKDNYCCLGVLCELAVAEGVIDAPFLGSAGDYIYDPTVPGDADSGSSAYLPLSVSRWSGLDNVMGHFLSDGELPYNSVAEMNDSEVPFSEIADVIEEKF